jgi:hypothetical protein
MKDEYKMLQVGQQYFPLKDVGKKFIVQDTVDYEIVLPEHVKHILKLELSDLFKWEMIYDYIEKAVWEEIMKDNYENVSWCRICHITESVNEGKLTVSIDLLEAV